jgi:hypothetical protein
VVAIGPVVRLRHELDWLGRLATTTLDPVGR